MAIPGFGDIASVIASGGALIKALSWLPWRRKVDPKEDYRFAKEFLADLDEGKDMPSYLRQTGYRALVRGAKVDPNLIDCAIRVKTYSDALSDCALGYPFLEARVDGSHFKLSFKSRYETEASRRWFRIKCFIGYAVFYLLATSPALLNAQSGGRDARYLWTLLFTLPSFFPLGIWALRKGMRLTAAERLLGKDRERLDRMALPKID